MKDGVIRIVEKPVGVVWKAHPATITLTPGSLIDAVKQEDKVAKEEKRKLIDWIQEQFSEIDQVFESLIDLANEISQRLSGVVDPQTIEAFIRLIEKMLGG